MPTLLPLPGPSLRRFLAAITVALLVLNSGAIAGDLPQIRQNGVLRHLGVPYANFVTGSGDGLDVEMVKRFAHHLGVRYEYVETTWADAIKDLTGKSVLPVGDSFQIIGEAPIKGDIVASGLTVLAWREKIIDFSAPVFPTQIWLVTRWDSPLKPIVPAATVAEDVRRVKSLLNGVEVMGKADTCLDPMLYGFEETGAHSTYIRGKLVELPPAVIHGEADTVLMEIPDVLMALEKWPGKLKVIGPVSPPQKMAYAVRKTTPRLRHAFNAFLQRSLTDGTYLELVKKYYPAILLYYPDFLMRLSATP